MLENLTHLFNERGEMMQDVGDSFENVNATGVRSKSEIKAVFCHHMVDADELKN